jgi:hypothetical protein
MNLTPVFNQYLRYSNIPELLIRKNNSNLEFKWNANEPNFNMPIDLDVNGKEIRMYPTLDWQVMGDLKPNDEVKVLTNNFYIDVRIE